MIVGGQTNVSKIKIGITTNYIVWEPSQDMED